MRESLLDFTDSILYKDLFKLAEVRKPTDLTKLVTFLAANVGSEIRYRLHRFRTWHSKQDYRNAMSYLLASCFYLEGCSFVVEKPNGRAQTQ